MLKMDLIRFDFRSELRSGENLIISGTVVINSINEKVCDNGECKM